MTIYYITADGRIVNNHDITRAYKKTDEATPFSAFREAWLAGRGGRQVEVTVDQLIVAGQLREAASLFAERYGCGIERAKNAVYAMRNAMRAEDGTWLVQAEAGVSEAAA